MPIVITILSLWNVFLAYTNFVALVPIVYSYRIKKYWTCFFLCNAMICSFIYHLFESHKHNLEGFHMKPKNSQKLLWLDRMAAFSLFIHMVNVVINSRLIYNLNLMTMMFVSFLFLFLSEYVPFFANKRFLFVLTHTIWHILAFGTCLYTMKLDYLRATCKYL